MTNVIKFQAPFERLKSYDSCPDIRLRKAIITQAIIDATNTSDIKAAKKLELEATSWILSGEESFRDTCIEAGLEPSFVIKLAKDIIKLHRQKPQKFYNNTKKNKRGAKTCYYS